jgi:hypothetical protein
VFGHDGVHTATGAVMADTPAMRQRMTALYGSPEASAPCDGRGDFSVGGLAPGSYFLIARVSLTPPRAGDRDYVIMRHLFLRRGEAREVALVP